MELKQRVLFIDDCMQRHRDFFKEFSDIYDISSAYSYRQAITTLKYHNFDQIFLDHDLSETEILAGNNYDIHHVPRTGFDIAVKLAEIFNTNNKQRPKVVIHSLNPVGRKNILKVLNYTNFIVTEKPFYDLLSIP